MDKSTDYTIVAIDIGGTFTDCFVSYGDRTATAKAPTTKYDLSVGFMDALKDCAKSLELSLEELVKDTDMVRYSTTLAMNTLIERKGVKLGLITTEGFEDLIYMGKGGSWGIGIPVRDMRCLPKMVKPAPLIPRHLIVGAKERTDSEGRIVAPLNEKDILKKIRYLADQGVRGFVVCTVFSHANPVHEQRIRQIIRQEYPESYLGAMPVTLSSDVLPKFRMYTRMVSSVLEAYLHQSMSDELVGMSDELRNKGYSCPLVMVHNSGGMADVFHTSGLDTYNGGPIAGIIGSAYVGKALGDDNIMVTDMGGTSFDLGMVVKGSSRFYQFRPVIDRWEVDLTMMESKSIGAGGGSIAWINTATGNRLEVGPRSAGANPGPACYDQGGTEPTVTDADLVLGYLDPNNFHGGKMKLNRRKAEAAIRERIAKPLNIEVVEAAGLIRQVVDANMADAIFNETVLRGYKPQEFVMFTLGGAGPVHACDYTFKAGINKIIVHPYASVFCAFGSAYMDFSRVYEQSRYIPIISPVDGTYLTDYEQFNSAVAKLIDFAKRDLAGQGLPSESAAYTLEIDMKYCGQLHSKRFVSPVLAVKNEEDVKAVYRAFEDEYTEVYSEFGVYPDGGVEIETFVIRAELTAPKAEIPRYPLQGATPNPDALKGQRDVYWQEWSRYAPTKVYERKLLAPGNVVDGPAVIEAPDTTIVLPPGRTYSVLEDLSGLIE
ncbi:MAG: hydantoinase/oxoprolinase family protein [Thermincola sp.]|nr:hydantoinase/oxoprolinase family protein [Thermincola sp.]MDT3702839.1 hydantoinase/oxoprolinase family protein [Thermincola sp.]